MKKLPNARPVVKRHLERTALIEWEKILEDPRSQINKEWSFRYLMDILWFGMLTGSKNLREVEDFSEGYKERVPDTTLHDILVKISPEPLKNLLVKDVKRALRDHELPREYFPVRLTIVDGKCVSVSRQSVGDFSQMSECNDGVQYVNRTLRAAHVSNETKLILWQREIHGKTNEMRELKIFLMELLENYKNTGLLEVISVDAGMNSKENADYIFDNDLDYIMALKNPQKGLVDLALELLSNRKDPDKKTEEKANGKIYTRSLYRCKAPSYPGWSHLKEFWRVKQETIDNKGNITCEERYFITSLNPDKLSNGQVLQAIRMHWCIENNINWVIDTAWEEDDSPWCNKALVFVSLLRLLAYNILSRLKARRLRNKDDRERSWKGIMKLINTVLIIIQIENNSKGLIQAVS
jgi:hypothetical protein